jgi:predicted nicotinamide N-methyase
MPDNIAFRELRQQIEQRVALRESVTQLAGRQLAWFRVADPEAILQQAVEAPSGPDQDPFWAAEWRSATGLNRFLSRRSLQGKRILELGCGYGAVGISAALRGGLVTMTDAIALALQIAELNAWPVRDRLSIRRLVWGVDILAPPPFSLIVGSDIVYDTSLHDQLAACLRHHLAPNGEVCLAEPHRRSGQQFLERMRSTGWRVETHRIAIEDGGPPIRIYVCRPLNARGSRYRAAPTATATRS